MSGEEALDVLLPDSRDNGVDSHLPVNALIIKFGRIPFVPYWV